VQFINSSFGSNKILFVFHSFHSLSILSLYQNHIYIFGIRKKVMSGSSLLLTGIVDASLWNFANNNKSTAAQYYLRSRKLANVLSYTCTLSYAVGKESCNARILHCLCPSLLKDTFTGGGQIPIKGTCLRGAPFGEKSLQRYF